MLPRKTLKNLKVLYNFICGCGSVPFTCDSNSDGVHLKSLSPSEIRMVHVKVIFFTTLFHTAFIAVRLVLAQLSRNQKFFLVFVHFSWATAFFMISWLHVTLHRSQFELKAYCNGLFNFFGSFVAMPGAPFTAREKRRAQKKPCLLDILLMVFVAGAVINTLLSVQIFLLFPQSYQFAYSALPPCWRDFSPVVIIPFIIYETALPAINWTLLLLFISIHLTHLLCTRDYLLMLRKNTRIGILKLSDLLHHYRSIQILHNHYNESVANYMPPELFVLLSLTLAANIGTIRMFHLAGTVSFTEVALFPLTSIMTGAFQIIFYTRAGDLHHLSSYFSRSARKGLFGHDNKAANKYLQSFPPLCVKAGNLLEIRKFTVVKFVGGVVVGTARLSVLIFNK